MADPASLTLQRQQILAQVIDLIRRELPGVPMLVVSIPDREHVAHRGG